VEPRAIFGRVLGTLSDSEARVRQAWEDVFGQPAAGNPLWHDQPWAVSLAAVLEKRVREDRADPVASRELEHLLESYLSGRDPDRYDPVVDEIEAAIARGEDPFEDS
jgi:hypothetical protein